ncbi:hypothetical protein MTP06_38850 [Streptomyces sp. PLM4]|nr:hypothetical protein MTP06_38850 [Streptomyces sp. PLM4]
MGVRWGLKREEGFRLRGEGGWASGARPVPRGGEVAEAGGLMTEWPIPEYVRRIFAPT